MFSRLRTRARLSTAAVVVTAPLGLALGVPHLLAAQGTDVAAHLTEVVPVLDEGLLLRSVAPSVDVTSRLPLRTGAERNRRITLDTPKGRHSWTASLLASHDVPSAARRAYRNAARTVDRQQPGCHLPWTLLAGIGRVESDHGRYGGSVLGADGVSRPAIVGVALDGTGAVAAIHDTDGGSFDGDTVWDRAVGPLQFIPSTWRTAGRDGDGDGTSSPNDIDDAALAAAGYLCHGGGDLRAPDAVRAAVFSYNPSSYYVDLVGAYARGYQDGSFVIPSPPVPADDGDGEVHLGAEHAGAGARVVATRSTSTRAVASRAATKRGKRGKRGEGGAGTRAHHASPHASSPHVSAAHPSGPAPTPTPTPTPTPAPTPTPTPAPAPSPAPSPTPGRLPSVHGPVTVVDGGWAVGTVRFTSADLVTVPVLDWDADGVVETVDQELGGLVAQPATAVTMTYVATPALAVRTFTVDPTTSLADPGVR